jgi:hypothetical protein
MMWRASRSSARMAGEVILNLDGLSGETVSFLDDALREVPTDVEKLFGHSLTTGWDSP